MLKKFYKITILPFTVFLLYLMFFGMGRTQYEDHVIRVEPLLTELIGAAIRLGARSSATLATTIVPST